MVLDRVRHRAAHRRRAPRWVRITGTILGVLAGLAAVLGIVVRYRTPGRGVAIGVSALSPYLLLGGPLALVFFAAARRLVGVAVAVALTGVLVVTQGPLLVGADAPAGGRPLVVMTANLHNGTEDAASLVASVRRHHVDVLMVQEVTEPEWRRIDAAGLDTVLTHQAVDPIGAASGTGIWSRYTLSGVELLRTVFTDAFVTARVQVPGVATTTTLAALHMAGPYPNSATWHRDMRHAPEVLRGLAGRGATVIGGDFNSTLDVVQFRDLLHGYADAAEQSGDGPTPTYPADRWFPPLIAIDHVLTHNAVATSADTIQIPGSDHRALLVTISVPPR